MELQVTDEKGIDANGQHYDHLNRFNSDKVLPGTVEFDPSKPTKGVSTGEVEDRSKK